MAECTGTAASYSRGCRCPRCTNAEKQRRLVRERNGNPTYICSDSTKARIEYLMRFGGLSKRQVCEQSGVDYRTVTDILSGQKTRVLDRTRRRVWAVQPDVPAWAYVDASCVQKTLKRLHDVQGYSYGFIADSCRLSPNTVMTLKRHRCCRRFVADAIIDFAEFVGHSPGIALDRRPNGRRALSNEQRIATRVAS